MYFFDTYALIEISKGNNSYQRFKELKIVTSVLNVGELYHIYLREYGKKTADEWYTNINFELLEITSEIIIKAVYFRFLNKKKNISLVDSVGYMLSSKHKLRFLTGDIQFKDLPNVEFVK